MQKLSYSLVFIITLLLAGCADAGQDKVAKSATTVVLEGNASTASVGGEIKKYKWKQVSGAKVKINNSKNKIITFTAPTVATEKILVFRLDTTEEGGHPNKFITYDCVRVIVQPSIGTDTTAPVITLNGESNITLYVGETYVEADATALDDVDGNVDVNLTGIVDTDTVGKYIIIYTAVDTAGNSVSVQRIVNVVENDDVNETNTTVQSISDGSESEGAIIIHEVNLSEVTTVPTVFDYKIQDAMAMANVDFNATPSFSNDGITFDSNHSTITVPAGINNFEIRIKTFKDFIFEVDETYAISLDDKHATGTIFETIGNDTNTTVKSISDDVSDSVNTATYNVVMTGELNESKEYSFSISGENNITTPQPIFTNSVTYNAEAETITVPAGIVDFSISVAVVEDVVHGKEKFTITIDGVSNHPVIEPIDPIIDTNSTQNENNNSITFEKGQYGDITLTADWSVPNDAIFLDIREDWERIESRPTGSIGGAIYGNQSFVEDVQKLVNNTNKQIILICHSGSRTTEAAELLSNEGFSNVWQIVGGMNSWEELKPNEILSGAL